MSRYYSYINTAEKIINLYKGATPFAIFIKAFFASEKKYGSNDRRQITSLCYQYFRVGIGLNKYNIPEKILTAVFLCNTTPQELLENIQPEWNLLINIPVADKMKLLDNALIVTDLFPFGKSLSSSIDAESFCESFLTQPYLFLRIREPNIDTVIKKLDAANIEFELENDSCLQLSAGTNIEEILQLDKEVVVQDYNSQKVLDSLKEYSALFSDKPTVWDCCSASGGKSILLFDILKGKCKITVSDIRPSILSNLHQRFKRAGIKNYHYFIADITATEPPIPANNFDIIICDAPCTGSGTWSRTPEQLYFFDPTSIDIYVERQKKIVQNAIHHLKKNGLFIYITCSVFAKENGDMATLIEHEYGLQLLNIHTLQGHNLNADSMFVAVFQH